MPDDWGDIINSVLDKQPPGTIYNDDMTNEEHKRNTWQQRYNSMAEQKAQRVPPEVLLQNLLGGQQTNTPIHDPEVFMHERMSPPILGDNDA